MDAPKTYGVIPTRWASTRFPGKILAEVLGTPALMYPLMTLVGSDVDEIFIATDDERIYRAAKDMVADAAYVHLDDAPYRNGTERAAGMAAALEWAPHDKVLILQADEVTLLPEDINAVLTAHRGRDVMTAVSLPREQPDANDVLVCLGKYQSRCPDRLCRVFSRGGGTPESLHHVGIYCVGVDALLDYPYAAPTAEEQQLSLEQLRWRHPDLHRGIRAVTIDRVTGAINAPDDVAYCEALLRS